MSGIEILGIAASVLQIADLGGRLSVKLFTFSRKIKNAHKSIDSISQDIAATGAILHQLGSELKKDEQLRLCSPEAVSTAKELVQECNRIFVELNTALDGGKSQTQGGRLILGWKDRLKFSFLEPQIDLLRSNLERLKSSLAVMLNVMIFAEQLRNQEALPILKEQRELIKTLVEDKAATQKRFEQALKSIDRTPVTTESPKLGLDVTSSHETPRETILTSFIVAPGLLQNQKPVSLEPVLVPPLPLGILRWKDEIEHYSALVKRLLDEASASHYDIDHGQRHRMQEGILHIHWEEWSRLRKMYNHETLLRAFSSRHPVSRFWQLQLERELPPFKGEDRHSLSENLPQYPGPPMVEDTADSYADVAKPPSPPSPRPVQDRIQHLHLTTEDENAIESGDDDDGEASESAIEEADAAWEDSDSEIGHASPVNKNMFQRVESRANLTPRSSMLAKQLHNPQRAMLANPASRTSPALRRSHTSPSNGPTPNNQSLPAAPLSNARNATGSPQISLHPPLSHADDADSDDESDVDLFRIPLSNKRNTRNIDDDPSAPTLSGGPDPRSKNVQYVSFGGHRVPPVPPVPLAPPPLQAPNTASWTKKGAPGRSVVIDFDELQGSHTDEQRPTPEGKGKEDVTALAPEVKVVKQEQAPSICSSPPTTVVPQGLDSHTISHPGDQGASHRVAVVSPLLSLEGPSSKSNLPESRSTQKPHEIESKVTPVTLSRVETVQKAGTGQAAVSSSVSKLRTALLERAKYQFEADSEDDEMEDEIDAKIKLLSGTAGRLNILAKATGIEVEAQNQHLQRISMKSDRLDGDSTFETDVVDDLLSRWTTLPKSGFGKARDINLMQNTERLKRIY